ncbi:MAG: hypothetical protein HDT42_04830 [Ruminococcaceae bacterium]|nr:hypothetical protein [Oscillospiraceae bacterium]
MDENAPKTQSDELTADVLQFAEMFERLSPEDKTAVLELLRQLNGVS